MVCLHSQRESSFTWEPGVHRTGQDNLLPRVAGLRDQRVLRMAIAGLGTHGDPMELQAWLQHHSDGSGYHCKSSVQLRKHKQLSATSGSQNHLPVAMCSMDGSQALGGKSCPAQLPALPHAISALCYRSKVPTALFLAARWTPFQEVRSLLGHPGRQLPFLEDHRCALTLYGHHWEPHWGLYLMLSH